MNKSTENNSFASTSLLLSLRFPSPAPTFEFQSLSVRRNPRYLGTEREISEKCETKKNWKNRSLESFDDEVRKEGELTRWTSRLILKHWMSFILLRKSSTSIVIFFNSLKRTNRGIKTRQTNVNFQTSTVQLIINHFDQIITDSFPKFSKSQTNVSIVSS